MTAEREQAQATGTLSRHAASSLGAAARCRAGMRGRVANATVPCRQGSALSDGSRPTANTRS